jgi:hypothetical protein
MKTGTTALSLLLIVSFSGLHESKAQSLSTKTVVKKTIQYGNQEGELGVARGISDAAFGPQSFTVAPNEHLFLADSVNNRVLIYSKNGEFVRSVSIPQFNISDVVVDEDENIIVYDHSQRTIAQFDSSGKLLKALALDPAAIEILGYFHIVGSSIYFANAANKDVLVGNISSGTLSPPDLVSARDSDGIHGESGKIYAVDIEKGRLLKVRVHDIGGVDDADISLSVPGILAARYVGEDQSGRFYIHTERAEQNNVVLEVKIFDSGGTFLATTSIPENDYAFWTPKLLMIRRSDGAIVQFLPEATQAKLRVIPQ